MKIIIMLTRKDHVGIKEFKGIPIHSCYSYSSPSIKMRLNIPLQKLRHLKCNEFRQLSVFHSILWTFSILMISLLGLNGMMGRISRNKLPFYQIAKTTWVLTGHLGVKLFSLEQGKYKQVKVQVNSGPAGWCQFQFTLLCSKRGHGMMGNGRYILPLQSNIWHGVCMYSAGGIYVSVQPASHNSSLFHLLKF